jgi:hypothetical protein
MNVWAAGKPAVQLGVGSPDLPDAEARDDHFTHERVADVQRDMPQLLLGHEGAEVIDDAVDEEEQATDAAPNPANEASDGADSESVEEAEPEDDGEANESIEVVEDTERQPRPSLIPRRSARLVDKQSINYKRLDEVGFGSMKDDSRDGEGYHTNVRACIQKHGDSAIEAVRNELLQMHEKRVFRPVKWNALTKAERRKAIRSFMFMKEKKTTDGVLQKIKARLVANGKQQDRELFEDVSSPTASTTALFTVASLAASQGWTVTIGDVSGAYLNAKMPESSTLMILERAAATVLCDISEGYKEYLREDGSLAVRLEKALYGCVESAKLWYEEIKSHLEGFGLRVGEADKCIFFDQRKELLVVLYVDDLFIAGADEDRVNSLFEHLEHKYGRIEKRTDDFDFLGMKFQRVAGTFEVSMDLYVEKLIEEHENRRKQLSPADGRIFQVDENSPELDIDGQKRFHSNVARLLYLAKRVRPDILVPVSFLTTRVKKASEEDERKLFRVFDYLICSGSKKLVLGMDGGQVSIFVDASFGAHKDSKSQSGILVTCGSSPIFCSSTKQKTTARSSFEAELIAVTDAMALVIWTRQLFSDIGVTMKFVLYQDNKGAIDVMRSGRCSGGTSKYIGIRANWLREKLECSDIILTWIDTESMLADLLTKGLVGNKFQTLRDKVIR